jgi:hypothetical protein
LLRDWADMPGWMVNATGELRASGIVGGIIAINDIGEDDPGPTRAA